MRLLVRLNKCLCLYNALKKLFDQVKRWPTILAGVVITLSQHNHELVLRLKKGEDSEAITHEITEGTRIIEKISGLKSEMGRDKMLPWVRLLWMSLKI